MRLTFVDRSLEPLAQRVQRHPRLAIAHLSQRELQLALAAEELDADVLDLVDRRGRSGSCERGVLECLGVHGSAEVTNVPAGVRPHRSDPRSPSCLNRPRDRFRHLGPSDMTLYERIAPVYDPWSSR